MDINYIKSINKLLIGSCLNFVDIYEFSDNLNEGFKINLKPSLLKRVFCPENCIVYSMSFRDYDSISGTVIIASGTVFTNLIIWEINIEDDFIVLLLIKLGNSNTFFAFPSRSYF